MAAKKILILVTAPAWPAHPEWVRQLLQVLGTRIEL